VQCPMSNVQNLSLTLDFWNLDFGQRCWLGRKDSNLRMPVPKTGALPLGYAPMSHRFWRCTLKPIRRAWSKRLLVLRSRERRAGERLPVRFSLQCACCLRLCRLAVKDAEDACAATRKRGRACAGLQQGCVRARNFRLKAKDDRREIVRQFARERTGRIRLHARNRYINGAIRLCQGGRSQCFISFRR